MGQTKLLFKNNYLLLIVLLLVLLLPGCAPKKETPKDPFFEKWREMATTSQGHSPSSKPRVIDLPERKIEPIQEIAKVEEPERPLPTMLVTMAMRNTDVNVIIRALARTSTQNIMMNDTVSGVTNINVTDTPWDQVFKAIMRTRGLTYKWEGDIIRVMTLEDMRHDREIAQVITEQKTEKVKQKRVEPLLTRVIPLNYLSLSDQGSSGGGESSAGGAGSGGGAGTSGESGESGGGQGGGSLVKNLEKLLTKNDSNNNLGSIMTDQHTNSLVVRASRDDLAEIINVIEQLDKPTPLVRIEALIVETTRDTARELGVQWGGLYEGTQGNNDHYITGSHTTTTDSSAASGELSDINSQSIINFPIDTSNLPRTGSMTLGFLTQNVGGFMLDVQLQALEAQSKLNILSRPSITSQDNQSALIESGTRIPVQTTDSEGATSVEYQNATLSLEVTPHVIEETLIKMRLDLSKDEVDFSRTVDGNPTIITKVAHSELILQDGETTVIGGLTKESSSGSDSGVPGLKDIPGLGNLFKGKGQSNKMEEILIFITPHILKKRSLQDVGMAAPAPETN